MRNAYAVVLTLLVALAPLSAMADVWGDQINDPTRFVVLPGYGGAAVLDQETGLVWEQLPSTSTFVWQSAQAHCNQSGVGNRRGWRLPTVQELASLVDPTPTNPALPAGHPFSNVQSSLYSPATTFFAGGSAWVVFFSSGGVGADPRSNSDFVWCVRGGQGVDSQ